MDDYLNIFCGSKIVVRFENCEEEKHMNLFIRLQSASILLLSSWEGNESIFKSVANIFGIGFFLVDIFLKVVNSIWLAVIFWNF